MKPLVYKRKENTSYRCRMCETEFQLPNTPKVAVTVTCPKCKSTDIEIM